MSAARWPSTAFMDDPARACRGMPVERFSRVPQQVGT
jgi:hypothetical protein